MKNIVSITLFCALILFWNSSSAKIWRVNNNTNTPAGADFADIQSAINSANSGDTIQVEGGNATGSYPGFSCDKRLTFIGTGYMVANTSKTQANQIVAEISGPISFNSGSSGTVVMGMTILDTHNGTSSQSTINISDSHITIARNFFALGGNISIGFPSGASSTLDSINISQNYIASANSSQNFTSVANSSIAVLPSTNATNLIISNNVFYNLLFYSASATGTIINNVFHQIFFAYLSGTPQSTLSFFNNIIQSSSPPAFTLSNNVSFFSYNNIYQGPSNSPPDANGNFSVADFTTIFVGWNNLFQTLSTGGFTPFVYQLADSNFVLKLSSPAIGAGLKGVDCGAFGGGMPYILSGMPPIPSIYTLSAPTSVTSDVNTMKVTISIASHN
jgi:hypothetical protein